MTLTAALKLAAAPVALALAGCVTNPIAQQADSAGQSASTPAKPSITWNTKECAEKNLIASKVANALSSQDGSCVFLTVDAAAQAPAVAAAATAPVRNRRPSVATPAPVAPAAPAAATVPTIVSALISAPACTAAANLGGTVSNVLDRGANLLGGLAGRFGGAATSAVGGGVAGNVAGAAGRQAGTAVAQQGASAAADTTPKLSAGQIACNNQIASLANNDFMKEAGVVISGWKAANAGKTPAVTIVSNLDAASETYFKNAATVAASVSPR